jgi:ferredoxin-type protein NapG
MLSSARAIGLASLGSLVWSAYLDEVTYSNLILRPPGALDEKDFLSACIKCGMCVEACPFDTLALAQPTDNKPLGTPFFIPRENPCRMCDDIPCVPVCPTGALDIKKVSTKDELDIDKSRMGLAIVDTKNCIAYWGIQCDACYRACPLMDKAITLKYEQNERTGKHAFLKPIVDSDFCTGCGMCERACVTKKPAIFVLPIEVATGTVGDHYIKGWDKKDEQRLNNAHSQTTITDRSKREAIDFLNDSEGLLND